MKLKADVNPWMEAELKKVNISLDTSANGNIITYKIGMENESSIFGNRTYWASYSQIWVTLGNNLNNAEVCHLLDFLVRRMIHTLMNIH